MKVIKQKIKVLMPLVWMITAYMWDMWYQIARGREMLDSDISSGILLSHRLNLEHSITGLSKNWIYATGIRFLESQWLYRLGLALFPQNWHMARTVAMALSLMLLAFSSWFVFYSIERSGWGLWAAALTLFPGGGWYFWQTIFGLQYTPYIIISHFSFALIMLTRKHRGSIKGKAYCILLMLLGLGAGLNGIKQLMVFYGPLCITAGIVLIVSIRRAGAGCFKDKSIYKGFGFGFFLFSILVSVMAVIGYLINSKYLARIYPFEQYESTLIEYQGFFECLKMYIWDFGFADGKKLMSFSGVASMCGVVFGLLVILAGIRLIMRYRQLSEEELTLSLLSATGILFCCFMFAYLSGHGDIQYFQPVIPMGYFLLLLEIFTEGASLPQPEDGRGNMPRTQLLAVNAVMAMMLLISIGTIRNESNEPIHKYRARPTLGPVVDMLIEKGYTQGVALFWTSNIVTELSDGKIEMWTLSTDSPEAFLNRAQLKEHIDNPPLGKYFYIFDMTRGEEEANVDLGLAYVETHQDAGTPVPIYYDENFIIYGN